MTKREEIRVKVYTFKLPKSVSSLMKVCIRLFKKDEEKNSFKRNNARSTICRPGINYESDYTRSIFPDFKALAETHTRLGLPSTRIRTF